MGNILKFNATVGPREKNDIHTSKAWIIRAYPSCNGIYFGITWIVFGRTTLS